MFVPRTSPGLDAALGSLPMPDDSVADMAASSSSMGTTPTGRSSAGAITFAIETNPNPTSPTGGKAVRTKQKRNKPTLSCLYVAPNSSCPQD